MAPSFTAPGAAWTSGEALPGGDIPEGDSDALIRDLCRDYPGLERSYLAALVGRHGTNTRLVLGQARRVEDLGRHFGAGLWSLEVDYFQAREWAATADDILWRRTKMGLHLDARGRREVAEYLESGAPMPSRARACRP